MLSAAGPSAVDDAPAIDRAVPEADLDLLVLGDCNPDLILAAAELTPAFGQAETLVDSAELTIGGSGAIVACGAARLGCRTAIAGVIGDDLFGRFMADALTQRGVDTAGLVVDASAPTGVTVVMARDGDRGMLTFPGTIASLTVAAVDPELIRRARHIHVSSFFLQRALTPGLPALFGDARRRGATVSVDPNWDPAQSWDSGLRELLSEIDILLPNAAEAMLISDCGDPGKAASALSASGTLVAVKLGADGALAVRSGVEIRASAVAVSSPVDTIGAGDSFDAGLLAGLLAGDSAEQALALACACGSLSTRARGGTAAQPTLDEAIRVP
jgi:sugar/nucleoside kinase (ribokinase family)